MEWFKSGTSEYKSSRQLSPSTVSSRKRRRHRAAREQRLGFEALEQRTLLSGGSHHHWADGHHKHRHRHRDETSVQAATIQPMVLGDSTQLLTSLTTSANTADKPQSKVWRYDDHWWSVLPDSTGTYVRRLDGTTWTSVLKLSSGTGIHADVKQIGDVAHVLLYHGTTSELASIQYIGGTYQLWLQRPKLTPIVLTSGVETATIDIDSTGRMWLAADATSTVEVHYSDYPYSLFSPPIVLANGITSDDITNVIAMPNGTVGVMWSNQNTQRFGFRSHVDGTDPSVWSNDEVPASQSALNVGDGMADDHLHVSVASDSTLFVAAKTSYDTRGFPKVVLLIRRPTGTWDDLIEVDQTGTRGISVLNESQGWVRVIYTSDDGGGDIVYRQSALSTIEFQPKQVLLPGSSLNNASSTKQIVTDELVVIASSGTKVEGALVTFSGVADQPPIVYAGPDQTFGGSMSALLDGSANEGHPNPPATLSTQWSKNSGPGSVTFANIASVDTTATFSAPGDYVLRLTATDGTTSSFDDVTLHVGSFLQQNVSFQNGVFPTANYAGTSDARIRSGSANSNYGGTSNSGADGSPDEAALLKWNVSAIPPGSVVQNASITLNLIDKTVDAYRFYALKRNWSETQVTWNEYASGTPWQTAGAQGSGDRGTAHLATVPSGVLGSVTIPLNAAGIALVQSWINDPNTNFGITLQNYSTAGDAVAFSTREVSTLTSRPKLNVAYLPDSSNSPPVAVADSVTVNEDGLAAAPAPGVLANDSDPDGNSLTAILLAGPSHGSLTLSANGSYTYSPVNNYNGSDSFTYKANDGLADSQPATVSITISAVNDPPTALADSYSTSQNSSLIVSGPGVLANDSDIEASSLTAVRVTGPSHGSLALDPNGSFVYVPQSGYEGFDSFTYKANDGSLDSVPATVTIAVNVASTSTTVSFQDGVDGYSGTRDTKIRSGSPTSNFRTAGTLSVDGDPDDASLIQWDLSSIPTGSVILSASITINISDKTSDSYEIYQVKRNWLENQATWDVASSGNSWEIGGAQGATDRGSTVLGLVTGALGLVTIQLNDAGIAAIQAWIDQTSPNYGIIVQDYTSADDALGFGSRETDTISNRPKLTITYQRP